MRAAAGVGCRNSAKHPPAKESFIEPRLVDQCSQLAAELRVDIARFFEPERERYLAPIGHHFPFPGAKKLSRWGELRFRRRLALLGLLALLLGQLFGVARQ